jgi:hypothetical protein
VEELTAAKAAEVLNEALACDANAINELFWTKVRCNQALTDHPTIIVHTRVVALSCFGPHITGTVVGPLGLLNGLLVSAGSDEVVAAEIDGDSRQIVKFSVRKKDIDPLEKPFPETLASPVCPYDTDGDGNCPIHPSGCPRDTGNGDHDGRTGVDT